MIKTDVVTQSRMSRLFQGFGRYKWRYLFVAPWALLFAAFQLYPLLLSFYLTFYTYNFIEPQSRRFVGLGNWARGIADERFWQSLGNIAYNQAIYIALTFAISLTVALLLRQVGKGGRFFRTVYFTPYVCSVVVVMTVGVYLTSPAGPIQSLLVEWGVMSEPVYWQFEKTWTMPVLAVINSWKWFGIQTVILLAGLISIDPALYEAASLDGASGLRGFWHITFPQLNPQILFILVTNVINGLQMFTEVFMNFDLYGGLHNQALTPVLLVYAMAFDKSDMGYASALGLLLAGLIFVLTLLQLRYIRREID
jgi:ABC-type sugar transport system permease subunit